MTLSLKYKLFVDHPAVQANLAGVPHEHPNFAHLDQGHREVLVEEVFVPVGRYLPRYGRAREEGLVWRE